MKKIKSILRQLNGEADEAEKQAFTQWLLKKPEHLDLYIDIKNLWEIPNPGVVRFRSADVLDQKNIGIDPGRWNWHGSGRARADL